MVIAGVFRFPVDELRLSFQLLFFGAVIFVFSAFLFFEINKWWGLFLIASLFSMYFPFYTVQSLMTFQAILYGIIWYALLVFFLSKNHTKYLMNAMCIIAFFHIAMLGLQLFELDPLFVPKDGGTGTPPVGLMSNRNEVSALLAFLAPAFFRPKWIFGLIPLAFGLLAAKSMGGVASLLVGVCFLAATKKNLKMFYIVLSLSLSAGLLYAIFIHSPSFVLRWDADMIGLKLFAEHWLFGSGIGHWKIVFKKIPISELWFAKAHNEYLQGAFEMGVSFIVITIGYLVNAIRRFNLKAVIPATAVVIIAVNSLFFFPFHIGTTAMVAVTWLAILEIYLNYYENSAKGM